MIKIQFTTEDIDALEQERYHHPHPKVQKRMEAVYLKSRDLPHSEICRICSISKTTLVTWLTLYQERGIEGLKTLGYRGSQSALEKYSDTLEAHFQNHPPRKISEAQAEIERITGIRRSPAQIRAFLCRLGMKWCKVGYVPGKSATPEKRAEQDAFCKQVLEPRLEEAKAGRRAVLFMDAAHFVHSVFLGWVWCFTRLFVASPAGRKRFNVLGAVDAVSKEIFTFCNDTYINSESVCALLTSLAQHYGATPLTVVLDNARYQKCRLVLDHAKALGIELLFLPSYSPHLNLIERLWRYVRKECLYSKYYSDFVDFKNAITNCLQTACTHHRKKLETLLSLNFQSFSKVKISTI